ncbi:proton-conducting transporter transmembrane domain-containing protein [Falsiroseomonas selenitidurans]|uniref:Hydrogenase 4 subunit F n=1 Tax=Falsiroseomonas selenitidurans TaxID=2716335 RepID=A0ABX1E6M7_9PROT|nr:proton-conducting transporter membrane subunit [Falsiroseomonas selenitidurans]NKC32613.1 hydrogenase 4 subunit F [Falsiroseomonas selenitidurans]
MMPLPWLVVFLPWLGAVALALAPPRGRLPALVNLGVAGGFCALALGLLGAEHGVQGWTRTDAVNLPLVALSGLIGLASAAFSAATLDCERFDGLRARAYHAAFQIFLGAQALALLSDNLGVMWVAIEIATLSSVLMVAVHGTPSAIEAAWKFFVLCGVGIALALFGTILLYLAAQPLVGQGDPGLSWGALRAVAAHCDPGILSLAFVFLLVGYGTKAGLVPLHAWLPDAEAEGPLPMSAVLSGLLLNAALLAVLRAKAVVGLHPGALAPGPLLVGFGLASLLLAAFALWRRRDARRLFAWSSIEHVGLSAIAFGLGAPFAGMLHLMGHSLVKSAVFFGVGAAAQIKGSQKIAEIGGLAASHPALGWGLALGIAGLAGLPPFALFVSEFLLVAQAAARQPWLILPLGLGLLVGATALIRVLQALCLGEPTPDRPVPGGFALPGGLLWATLPLWSLLALAVLLGFALPPGLAALLSDAAVLLE